VQLLIPHRFDVALDKSEEDHGQRARDDEHKIDWQMNQPVREEDNPDGKLGHVLKGVEGAQAVLWKGYHFTVEDAGAALEVQETVVVVQGEFRFFVYVADAANFQLVEEGSDYCTFVRV